jgi:hypothetical protein
LHEILNANMPTQTKHPQPIIKKAILSKLICGGLLNFAASRILTNYQFPNFAILQ